MNPLAALSGFDIGVAVTLGLYGLTQIGGGLWILSYLKTKSLETDKKLDKLEESLARIDAKLDRTLAALRTEVHADLSGLRSEMTTLAIKVGETIGRQDAKG